MTHFNKSKKDFGGFASTYGWQCPICRTVYSPYITQCNKDHSNSTRTYTAYSAYGNPTDPVLTNFSKFDDKEAK